MKSNRLKAKAALPESFQEVLITHEMKFEKNEINLDLIRKLIYLYSVNIPLI
jgi:hypothetical protein